MDCERSRRNRYDFSKFRSMVIDARRERERGGIRERDKSSDA